MYSKFKKVLINISLAGMLLISAANTAQALAPKTVFIKGQDYGILALRPVSIATISDFVKTHSYLVNVYRSGLTYPNGCKSFSYLATEIMEKEGIDVRIRHSALRDHFYLSVLAVLADGSLDEVIIDFTADQCGIGKIAALVETRSKLKEKYPEAYRKYWSEKALVYSKNEVDMTHFYMEYIQVLLDVYSWLDILSAA